MSVSVSVRVSEGEGKCEGVRVWESTVEEVQRKCSACWILVGHVRKQGEAEAVRLRLGWG